MELRRIFNDPIRFKTIFEKLPTFSFPHRTTTSNPQTLRIYKGIAFILTGSILALSAHQWSHTLGAEEFARETWPHEQAWTNTLQTLGYRRAIISENAELLQNHPDPYRQRHDIWASDDARIIYLSLSPFEKDQPELWTRGIEKGKEKVKLINWIHLGSGITAFNELVKKIETHPWSPKTAPPESKRGPQNRIKVDPKEIRY